MTPSMLAPRLLRSPQPEVEAQSPKKHTESDWESRKGLIRRLYIHDNCKLSSTMSIMKTKHAFAAREQMYKKRLKKWDIRKRIDGKTHSSTPTFTGTSTPSQSVANSPLSVCQLKRQDDPDEEEVAHTLPPLSRAIMPVKPPALDEHVRLEVVLSSVFSWSRGKIQTRTRIPDLMSKYLSRPDQPPVQDSRTLYRTFELVFELWHHGKGGLAGLAARKAFYLLEYVLTEDHPDVIWHILDTIYDMINVGHLQLLRIFLDHTTALAHLRLPEQHPLVQILQLLHECNYRNEQGRDYTCHLLRRAWSTNVEILVHQIKSTAPQHLWLYEQLIWDGRTPLRKNTNLEGMKDRILSALQHMAANRVLIGAGADLDALRIEALILEFTQLHIGDHKKAEQLALQLINHTENPNDPENRSNARFQAYARRTLARLHDYRFEETWVEQNLKWAIYKREIAHGKSHYLRVVRDIWALSKHYRQTGRSEEAGLIVQKAVNRVAAYLSAWVGTGHVIG